MMSSQGTGCIFARQLEPSSLIEVTSKPDLRRDLFGEPILENQIVHCRIGIHPNFIIEVTNGFFIGEAVPFNLHRGRFVDYVPQAKHTARTSSLSQVIKCRIKLAEDAPGYVVDYQYIGTH